MDHRNELQMLLIKTRKERDIIRNELRNYPNANLMLTKNHDALQKYMIIKEKSGERKVIGIGKSPELIHKLARRKYLLILDRILKQNLDIICKAIDGVQGTEPDNILNYMPKHFEKLPTEMFLTSAVSRQTIRMHPSYDSNVPIKPARLMLFKQNAAEWGMSEYRQNALYADRKKVIMPNGLKVRSKSEAAILERYDRYKIPVHYDEILFFLPDGNNDPDQKSCSGSDEAFVGIKTGSTEENGSLFQNDHFACTGIFRSPDFVAARQDGKLIYHEHFGLMNDSQYLSAAQEKLQIYSKCGIVPWDNLIITYDDRDGGIDLRLVDAMLADKGLI